MTAEDAKKWFGVYYGQNREDLIIKAFFPDVKKGLYIDVGAHDPDVFSVTKIFYELGWRGVNIEPQKEFYQKLAQARPLDTNINLALGSTKGEMKLREYPDASGLSTISKHMIKKYKADNVYKKVTKKYYEYPVEVKTLKHVFEHYLIGKKVNFLKIDVEGFEREVLIGNDWKKFRPMLICIEANHLADDWHQDLASFGYKLAFQDGLNEYHIAEEYFKKLTTRFDYTKVVLSKIYVNSVPFEMLTGEMEKMEGEIQKLNSVIKKQDTALKDLTERHNRIIQSKSFKTINYVRNKTKKLRRHRTQTSEDNR